MAEKVRASLSLLYKFGDESAGDTCSLYISRDGNIITGHTSKLNIWKKSHNCTESDQSSWVIDFVLNTPVPGDVNTICEISIKDQVLLVFSVDSSIVIYEQHPYKLIHHLCCNKDEINQLAVNEKGNMIGSCDDSGEVKMIDTCSYKVVKTLNVHENICSSVRFIPRRPWELVSGGLDCKLVRWDFNRGRPLAMLNQSELQDSSVGGYAINPPMVYTLDVFPSTSTVVCGLGSGLISVYALKSGRDTELLCTGVVHSASIECVCAHEVSRPNSESTHQYIISGGNDRKLCVNELVVGEKSKRCLRLLSQVDTHSKINCVALNSGRVGEAEELTVFVSDLTYLVSAYKFIC